MRIKLVTKHPLFHAVCGVFFLLYPQAVPLYAQVYAQVSAQESVFYTLNNKGRCIPSIPFDSKSGEILGVHWRDGEKMLPIPDDGAIIHRSDVNIVVLTSGYAPGTCVEVSLDYEDSEWPGPAENPESFYAHGFVDPYGRVLIRDALLYYDGWIN
ncbi:TPA: hypothetical protein ACOVFI_004291 [Citrobacter braakii]